MLSKVLDWDVTATDGGRKRVVAMVSLPAIGEAAIV